jgi:hypothetical protein
MPTDKTPFFTFSPVFLTQNFIRGKQNMHERFIAEVLIHGAQACLPRNLPKEWLDNLGHELWEYFVKTTGNLMSNGNENGAICCSLGAIVVITSAKLRQPVFNMSMEDIHERLGDYRIELALETVHRSGALSYEPATLETIFTDRKLTMSLTALQKIVRN